jgi:hypothetical protein
VSGSDGAREDLGARKRFCLRPRENLIAERRILSKPRVHASLTVLKTWSIGSIADYVGWMDWEQKHEGQPAFSISMIG